jgi:hypothetical protein
MAALLPPHADDVIIRHQPTGSFTIGVRSGAPQILCGSLDEALERAAIFATKQHAQLWYTADGTTCAPVNLLGRIWNEYIEMPGLRLTSVQAQRLWGVDAQTCTALLESLVDLKFLVRGPDGKYARLTEGSAGRLRMAKAQAGNPLLAHLVFP